MDDVNQNLKNAPVIYPKTYKADRCGFLNFRVNRTQVKYLKKIKPV